MNKDRNTDRKRQTDDERSYTEKKEKERKTN